MKTILLILVILTTACTTKVIRKSNPNVSTEEFEQGYGEARCEYMQACTPAEYEVFSAGGAELCPERVVSWLEGEPTCTREAMEACLARIAQAECYSEDSYACDGVCKP